ncbi:MAG: hypothetical protein QMD25_00335 [Caldisericia bacterium]|nr:hypothetical protein [Caldisericia bacterium]
MNTLKINENLRNLIDESFINKFLTLLGELYSESFISKVFNLIKDFYYESFIFKILKKEDEDLSLNLNIFKIKYNGNYKSVLIFFIILSIPYILKIQSFMIKLLLLFLLYFIFISIFINEDLIKNSFIFRLFGGKND